MPGMTGSVAADVGTLEGRLTATRAGYLDRLAIIAAGGAGEFTAARAALLSNLDAAISSRMGSIKSIQRGSITAATGSHGTATATISAVTTTKCFSNFSCRSGLSSTNQDVNASGALTNSTTVTATTSYSGSVNPGEPVLEYEIVEVN